jgi:tRNA(Ser,Leu) C12 N-acetylase TAN1
VPDVDAFTRVIFERVTVQPGLLNLISRIVPGTITFDFQSPVEFEAHAKDAVVQLAPALVGKRFHVRIHRRGFKHRIVSPEEERQLDHVILAELAAKGPGAEVAFDDPDVIVAIETVGQRACVSAWSREDLARYPFLRLD